MTSTDIEVYELAVIGGGIKGAGIERDAEGRGLRVLPCETADKFMVACAISNTMSFDW